MSSVNLPSAGSQGWRSFLETSLKLCATFTTLPFSKMTETLKWSLHTIINNSTISSFNSLKTLEWISYSLSDFLVSILPPYWITSSTVSSVPGNLLLRLLKGFGASLSLSTVSIRAKHLFTISATALSLLSSPRITPSPADLESWQCFLLLCWGKRLDLLWYGVRHIAYRAHAIC